MTRGEEILEEDSWEFVAMVGKLQLWKKFSLFVFYNPAKDQFSHTMIGDPRTQKPNENGKEN